MSVRDSDRLPVGSSPRVMNRSPAAGQMRSPSCSPIVSRYGEETCEESVVYTRVMRGYNDTESPEDTVRSRMNSEHRVVPR